MELLVAIVVIGAVLTLVLRRVNNPSRLEHRRIEALRALHQEKAVEAAKEDS